MRSRLLRSGTAARWAAAVVVVSIWIPAGAVDPVLQHKIDRIHSDTQDKLDAMNAARAGGDWRHRMTLGGDYCFYDNCYTPASLATVRMSRNAPPGAGAEWLVKAAQAWKADLDGDASTYLRRASEAGSAIGTRLLGAVYAEGIGVPKNEVQALALFRQAATMGDAEALLHLGRAYALGYGTPVDYPESLDWFTKASRRAATRAQGETGAEAVRLLERTEAQRAELERCAKAGTCEPPTAAVKP